MDDMPTPERLVEQDLPMFGQQSNSTGQPRDIDNKVANFLAVSRIMFDKCSFIFYPIFYNFYKYAYWFEKFRKSFSVFIE